MPFIKNKSGAAPCDPNNTLSVSSHPPCDVSGFTLVDMAIALVVIGLLVAPLIHQYRRWQAYEDFTETSVSVNLVDRAVQNFYHLNGRYPCPANPSLNAGDPGFGAEFLDGSGGACNASLAIDPLITGPVYEGAVPFAALHIDAKNDSDAWGNKIVYAVTRSQADPGGTFNDSDGALTIREFPKYDHPVTGEAVCPDPDNLPPPAVYTPVTLAGVHYTVFSTGQTGIGATYKNGNVTAQACQTAGGSPPRESENCDKDVVYLAHTCMNSTGLSTLASAFYDDIMMANATQNSRTVAPSKTWTVSTANGDDIGADPGFLGIGKTDPNYTVDVAGNVKADDLDPLNSLDQKLGNASALDFCTGDGEYCFDAPLIAGDDPGMRCDSDPKNRGMTGIGSKRAKCEVSYQHLSGSAQRACPAGTTVTGLSKRGVCCDYICP